MELKDYFRENKKLVGWIDRENLMIHDGDGSFDVKIKRFYPKTDKKIFGRGHLN